MPYDTERLRECLNVRPREILATPLPRRELEVRYGSKETSAPSEIVVPAWLYPDGFYVWVSDGVCHYDPASATLYHHPGRDEPGVDTRERSAPSMRSVPRIYSTSP